MLGLLLPRNNTINKEVNEPTLRRSESLKLIVEKFQDYYHSLFEASSEFNLTPNSYKEIESLPNRDKWLIAVDEELNSMKLNNVWKVVKNKENVKPLKSK